MPKQGEKTDCKNCRHFEPNGTDGHPECHLHPPIVVVQHSGDVDRINSAFPWVHPDDWCNDWCLNT